MDTTPLLESNTHTADLRRQDDSPKPVATPHPTRFWELEQKAAEKVAQIGKGMVESKLIHEIDSISKATHYLTQGHVGEITCVCADHGADCIVTGGADGTMRMWSWDSHHASCFVLMGVVQHGPGDTVKSVACIDSDFIASGTDKGDIFYVDTKTKKIDVKRGFHRGGVHDLSMKHGGLKTCFVTLENPSAKLPDSLAWQRRGLTVTDPDLFKKWNAANPSVAVQKHDYITKVNGMDLSNMNKAECEEFIKEEVTGKHSKEEVKGRKVLKVKILRYTHHQRLVASGGSYFAKVVALKGAYSPYSLTVLCELNHGCKISKVKFLEHQATDNIDGWNRIDLRLLTSALDGTRLWNINDSSLLLKLETAGAGISDVATVHGVCIPENSQSMLISVWNNDVSVWNLDKCEQHQSSEVEMEYTVAKSNFTPFSSVQYIESSMTGEWIISVVGQKCIRWNLTPNAKCNGCGAWRSDLEAQLPVKKKAKQLPEMVCPSHVTTLNVFEDPDDGAILVCGCRDGQVVVWDVGGDDAGEVIARLRSLTHLELFGPMILMMISFIQVSSFAFGAAVPWFKHSEAASKSRPSFLVLLMRANISLLINGDPVSLFYASTWSTLAVMTLFVVLVATDSRKLLQHHLNLANTKVAQKDDSKKDENRKRPRKDKKKYAVGQPKMVQGLRILLAMIDTLIWSCCTVLIVPMSISMVQAVSCAPDPAVPGRLLLNIAPEVHCFEGRHRDMVTAMLVVAPVFFFLLFPFALVHGDSTYVQRTELFSIKAWRWNAIRKATIFHLGPFHPSADNVFATVCAEVAAKIALPAVAKLITVPLSQMKIATTLCGLLLLGTVMFNPMIEMAWNVLLISLRLWTLCAMACAYLAVALDDPGRPEPMQALCACSVSIFVVMLIGIYQADHATDHNDVIRLWTDQVDCEGREGREAAKPVAVH